MKKQTVLILGAGFSGMTTALWLDYFLGDRLQIILTEKDKNVIHKARSRHSIGTLGYSIEELTREMDGLPPSGCGTYWKYPQVEEEEWIKSLWEEVMEGVKEERVSVLRLAKVLRERLLKSGVTVYTERKGVEWRKDSDQRYCMWFRDGNPIEADYLVFAVGGGRPSVLKGLSEYGIPFNEPLPGFRDLRIEVNRWKGIFGIRFKVSSLTLILGTEEYAGAGGEVQWNYPYIGGRAISRATAQWAEKVAEANCAGILEMRLLPEGVASVSSKDWVRIKGEFGSREVGMASVYELPLPLWRGLLVEAGISLEEAWNKLDMKRLARVGNRLLRLRIPFEGYRLNKEEHFSVGGVPASALKMDYMETLKERNLFFCGEVVDIRLPSGGAGYVYGLWSGLRVGAAIAERFNEGAAE